MLNTKHLKIILGVLLSCIFSVRGQTPTPGGVTNANYEWLVWLTPDSYSSGVWTNKITNSPLGNFSRTQAPLTQTTPAPKVEGYNYHDAARFTTTGNGAAPNQMESFGNFSIVAGQSFATFIVARAGQGQGDTWNYIFSYGATGTYTAHGVWAVPLPNTDVRFGWPGGTSVTLGTTAFPDIITIDNPNLANTRVQWYNTGAGPNQSTGNTNTGTINTPMRIGSCRYDANGERGFNGDIQEIIILKKNNTGYMFTADLAQIHSYLAIKYGLTLGGYNGNDDYLRSNGSVVFSRNGNGNAGYNKYVFGIGRDDETRLNQVQSHNKDNPGLSLFKGTYNARNDNSSTAFADNNTFVMLGSNDAKNTLYEKPKGQAFADSKTIDEKLNYFSSVYRAQVTVNGSSTGASQTVGVRVESSSARYVLVSTNQSFPTATTRIYPITGGIANNVVINNGDFLTFAGYESTPGGVDMAVNGYSLDLWVDGNHSTNSTWENIAESNHRLMKSSTNAPLVRDSRFNFHRELFFGNTASSKLRSSANFQHVANDAYYMFVVSDAVGTNAEQVLLAFNNANAATNTTMRWQTTTSTASSNNVVNFYWPTTTVRNPGLPYSANPRYGIFTVNWWNSTTNNQQNEAYLNGRRGSTRFNSNTASTYNNFLYVGNANNSATTGNTSGFNGSIQEIILIRKSAPAALMQPLDLAKVHSYLAIKYGITLVTDANAYLNGSYVNSMDSVVWDKNEETRYNNMIFGIGRDDESGLYQKQSFNVEQKYISVFVGNALADLNSNNHATIEDMQYLMLGSDGGSIIQTLMGIRDGDEYENDTIESDIGFNVQTCTYKAKVTGPSPEMTVNVKAPTASFTYALVSKSGDFDPADTKIYITSNQIAEVVFDQDYKYFKFVGFAPGPGGVSTGLTLWLRADDETSLTLEYMPLGDRRIQGYTDHKGDPDAVPAVSEWKDLMHGQTYSYVAGGNSGGTGTNDPPHKYPVMVYSSPEMNYHPALKFYVSPTGGAYLANAATNVMGYQRPPDGGHAAYFMVNNNFGTNDWVYPMSFGGTTLTTPIPQPGWGAEQYGTGNNRRIAGRFRTSASQHRSTAELFKAGSTSIMGFSTNSRTGADGTANDRAYFRFNARQDSSVTENFFAWNNINFQTGSTIGTGYNYSRIIIGVMAEAILINRDLDPGEKDLLDSYLALKYGVTLEPNFAPYTYNRFTYKFSNTDTIWNGNVPTTDKYGRFYNNVAAVIRDDAAQLHNKQAHSTNVGSILHLGVAGTTLDFYGDQSGLGEELNNNEAVVFGCDNLITNTHLNNPEACGDFTDHFNRQWLVRKITRNDRPITLLVGAQDNSKLMIGDDDEIKNNYYNRLGPGYDVSLIICETSDDLLVGNYKAVVPMYFINGEHQCAYTFTEEETFITFGWKENDRGCMADEEVRFQGAKTFEWTQWTAQTNRLRNNNITIPITPFPEVDLGDGLIVTSTKVQYPLNVRPNVGFPRSVNTPSRGSLQVQSNGAMNEDVVITINFNTPVIPEFTISGIDGAYRSWKQIEVYGECEGHEYAPKLEYAGNASSARYKITGNVARAYRDGLVSGSSKDGMVNVQFRGGVTSITIKYRTTLRRTTANLNIYISPIKFRQVPPPPPINEDGLSFVKQVAEREITTCDPVEYSFYLQNVNCEPKYVDFTDVLPDYMTWDIESLALDSMNSLYNTSIKINEYGGTKTLKIDSLMIPGASTIRLTAKAAMDEMAPSNYYSNRAHIAYELLVMDVPTPHELYSVDRETLDTYTTFWAEWQERLKPVEVEVITKPVAYGADKEIEITYKINSPEAMLSLMFLDIDYNEEFSFVAGSMTTTGITDAALLPVDPNVPNLSFVSKDDPEQGFTIPMGESTITFRLKAPVKNNLVEELNDEGELVVTPLMLVSNFSTEMTDPCILQSMTDMSGVTLIEYSGSRTAIITNQNVTTKIQR